MQIPQIPSEAIHGALAIGNFDGVHLGHRSLIQRLREEAKRIGGPAVVLTFDPPPLRLLRPELPHSPLTTVSYKEELLLEAGADHVVILPTTHELLQIDAPEFFDRFILKGLCAKSLIEGENFRFGKGRGGDVRFLAERCAQHGIDFRVVRPELKAGEWISSTRIRHLVREGRIEEANGLLLRPYRLFGRVGKGAQRGRLLGFPTANLEEIPVLLPKEGVYAARVVSSDRDESRLVGKKVALHLGGNPTFGEGEVKVEAHVLDYEGDLYGARIGVEILSRIREVQRFASKEALLEQLKEDIRMVRGEEEAHRPM